MPKFPPVPSHVPYHPDPHAHLYNPFAHVDHPAYGAPVHPPQYWGGYPPTSQGVGVPPAPAQLSERTIKRGRRKAADLDDAPPSKKRAIQFRSGSDHTQGLAHQTPAPPCYPATFLLVQTYHPHTQQGLGEQTPAEESAVKHGKHKAVELDDAPPRQAIQHRVDGFHIISINGSISHGGSSNIGRSSRTQEEAVAQVPCVASTSKTTLEFFADSFED